MTYGNGNSKRNLSDKDQWYNWNLTGTVKKWLTNASLKEKGLQLRTYTSFLEENSIYSDYMKTFSSMQGDADYKPYFVIDYSSNIEVNSISLSKSSLTITVGNTSQLTATVSPNNASNKGVSWSSSNTAVAVVDSNGKITGKSSGTATIYAKSKSNSSIVKECAVKVESLIINNKTSGIATFLIGEESAFFPFTFPTYLDTEVKIDSINNGKKKVTYCYAIGYYTNTTAEINPIITIAEHKIGNQNIAMGKLKQAIIVPGSWIFDAKEAYINIWVDQNATCYTSVIQRIDNALYPISIISDTFNL